ncbi:hypothetical protein GGI43DRAFT_233364 [Trichoderma evansii]
MDRPKRYYDESQCVCEPLNRAVRCRQNRDQRPDFGENRNARLAMHCGDPSRVRTSRVGRCKGSRSGLNSVSWPRGSGASLVAVCTSYPIPRSCFRRRRKACEGGLVFFLIKVVQRPLRIQI